MPGMRTRNASMRARARLTAAVGSNVSAWAKQLSRWVRGSAKPGVVNYIYGLGGRDLSMDHVRQAVSELEAVAKKGTPADNIRFLGLRE